MRRAQDVVKSVDLLPRKHATQRSHAGRKRAVLQQFIYLGRKVDTHAMIIISILQQQLLAPMCVVLPEKPHRRSDCVVNVRVVL